MFQRINKIFYDTLSHFFQIFDEESSLISHPPNHIDNIYHISSNIAMKYKYKNFSQIEFASILKDFFLENYSDFFVQIDVINPGFLNFKISNEYINEYLRDLYKNSLNKIFENLSSKKYDLNLEFVSCNPTGPMHVGHLRGAILGDSIAELLKSIKCNVIKEFYINDGGNQIENLTFSAFLSYYKLLNLNIFIEINEQNLYRGLYIEDLAKEIIEKFGKDLSHKNKDDFKKVKLFSVEYFLNNIKNTLRSCDIIHNVFTSEEKILSESNLLENLLNILDQKDLIYYGNIEKPDHVDEKKMNISTEDKLLFKSTLFGDEKDRVIQKSDGTFTYFAKDCAYTYHKYQRSKNLITLLGIDHKGHEKNESCI